MHLILSCFAHIRLRKLCAWGWRIGLLHLWQAAIMTCLLETVQLLKPFISCFVAHSIFSCSQRGFFAVYRFYVKAVNPNITFGARDFYVLSVLLDSICFCLFVLGFSSFGVSVCTYVHTYFCVHLSVSLTVFVRVCVRVCVSPPNDTSPLPTLLSSILPSLSPHPWPHPMTPPPLSSLLPPSFPPCPPVFLHAAGTRRGAASGHLHPAEHCSPALPHSPAPPVPVHASGPGHLPPQISPDEAHLQHLAHHCVACLSLLHFTCLYC